METKYIVRRFNSSNSELYHHGVKGMKWGVRRYRNKDGSYTEAGKKRNLKKIEKSYLKSTKNNFEDHNSGKAYRDFARKNPDIAKSLGPAIKAEQKLLRAIQADDKLYKNEYNNLVKGYVKKHNKYPDGEDDHVLSNKARSKVGTPNWDAQVESHRATGRDAINDILGIYGDTRLNTFNTTTGKDVLYKYISIEAQLRNHEED